MTENTGHLGWVHESGPVYDLEERTETFARDVRLFVRKLRPAFFEQDDIRQLVKASGSVGANYIEANDALSKKDFVMRAKICRKESKESGYWLRLLFVKEELSKERDRLHDESKQLMKIFGAIVRKCE